jgi:hypothetical protein
MHFVRLASKNLQNIFCMKSLIIKIGICIRGRSQTTFTGGGGLGGQKTFCKLLYHRKCKRRG